MTRQEYAEYEAKVARFFEREGINDLSADGEPYFSWGPCDCCGSPLGGNRYQATAYCLKTKDVYDYEICSDCLYYSAYGQLDDMTMMEMAD